jgi:hypothetical protein
MLLAWVDKAAGLYVLSGDDVELGMVLSPF